MLTDTAAAPFAALADIVERLARMPSPEAAIPDALAIVGRTVGATAAGVWTAGPAGMRRRWGTGPEALPPADATWRHFPLVAGDTAHGVIAVALGRPLDGAEERLCASLANLLAPELAHLEQQRRLETEVATRSREMDEQRRLAERVIDALPLGLYVVDREYRIRAWNRRRETGMQGVSREDAIGRPIFEILHRQPAEMLRREFDEVFATGRIQTFQTESRATGDPRTYRLSKIPMRVSDGEVTHVITIGEDVTEWKETQERVSQAEKLAAIGQLAAGVMHEINNPLATIAACAEGLALKLDDLRRAGGPVPEGANDYVQIIGNEVHRCKQIVDGLLDFSRPRHVRRERVNLNEVIEKTLFLLKHHVRFKQLQVHTLLDPAIGRVPNANSEQLVQVFMALLLNAMDAMGARGTVTVRTRPGRGGAEGVIAEVIDAGHGIPRSELSKIFEPFYTTKAPGKGTGLGLSICYGILVEHGGRIEVDSVLGQGSTFRVVLPVVEPM